MPEDQNVPPTPTTERVAVPAATTPPVAPVVTHQATHGLSLWTLAGVLVVILLLLLGGFYLWGMSIVGAPETSVVPMEEAIVEETPAPTPSDELDALEAELSAQNVDDDDSEMAAIEEEINAGMSAE